MLGSLTTLGLWLAVVAAPAPLDPTTIGVYGTCYDFCGFSVYKLFWHGSKLPNEAQVEAFNQRLRDTRDEDRQNLLLLYPFDRVSYAEPLENYLGYLDQALAKLDLDAVDVLCLAEENVTWHNGLTILNALYDRAKERTKVPVYQWLTMPDPPHPDLRADGWIIDPYGFDGPKLRRYLTRFLLTGKPVIGCLTASPDPNAPFDITVEQQFEVYREFAVPMFFFCVDQKFGSPNLWLMSDEPGIVRARQWLMQQVELLSSLPKPLTPRSTTAYSDGSAVTVCGGPDLSFTFTEAFENTRFLDDTVIRGLDGLRWVRESRQILLRPQVSRLPEIALRYHFTSPFPITHPRVELGGELDADTELRVGLMPTNLKGAESVTASEHGPFTLVLPATEVGRDPIEGFWVNLTAFGHGGVKLDRLTVTGQTVPPAEKVWRLDPTAHPAAVETFDCPQYVHLAEVEGDPPEWRRGAVWMHGIEGRGSRGTITWKLVSPTPLESLRVTIEGRTNTRFLAGHTTATLLTEDGTELATVKAEGEGNRSGWLNDSLGLSAEALPIGTTTLRLRLQLSNSSGKLTNTSSEVRRITIDAVPAQ